MDTTEHADVMAPVKRRLLPIGIAGWAATALLFGGQVVMLAGGPTEPAFDAPTTEIQYFFETRAPTLVAVGSCLQTLGLLALLWFVCGLTAALRRRATRHEWLPTVVLASSIAAVGCLLVGSWQAAAFRAGEGLDPQLARFAFDISNLTFANAWVALGSLAVASGWAILAFRAEPGWLGWWAVTAGVGLVAARTVWTTSWWLLPYSLFWLWVLVISTRMLRNQETSADPRAAI